MDAVGHHRAAWRRAACELELRFRGITQRRLASDRHQRAERQHQMHWLAKLKQPTAEQPEVGARLERQVDARK